MNDITDFSHRHLNWEGCRNTRDLGGMPTVHGTPTRRQSVIRSDLLGRLTATGRKALVDFGVRTIIDLRGPHEVGQEPSPFQATSARAGSPAYLNLPLEKYEPHVGEMITRARNRAEVYCIILDHYADAVAEVMRAVAGAGSGGVVIHCHSGTDRTGIVSALLLDLAGVPAPAIAADYAQSQQRLWPLFEQAMDNDSSDDFWSRPTATAEMMDATLAHLQATYGGAHKYLTWAGMTRRDLAHLRQRLTDP